MLALVERDLIERAEVAGDRRDAAREPAFNCEILC